MNHGKTHWVVAAQKAVIGLGLSMLGLTSSALAETPALIDEEAWAQIPYTRESPFASELYTFFVQDEVAPPAPCRTVFIGSSSIRFWFSLAADFPSLDPLNRGFGGSQIEQAIGYFDRLLTPHAPREIVFYSGENDLNAGQTPEQVLARFETFMALKTDRLGDAPVYVLSIKPSVARLDQLPAQRATNALIADFAETREDLIYVDIATPMMADAETPQPIFISDQLHMNASGYAIWTDVLTPLLTDPARPVRTGCSAMESVDD